MLSIRQIPGRAILSAPLFAWGLLAASLFILLSTPLKAATLPSGFTETRLIGGINPTCVEVAPDGRVFLCEKQGRIRIYKDGKWLAAPLLTVDADFAEERGLLGLALHPDFPAQPYLYLYYTAKNPAHNRVSRFRLEGDAATGPEQVILELNTLGALRGGGWHNGGGLRFGKDGKLYVATGNNNVRDYSQSLGNLLGKILRLNADGSIPTDNPFYGSATGANRAIWALGLRNPHVLDIHPATGRMLFNEVGDGSYEEIGEAKAGANYGYPRTEGPVGTAPTGLTGTYANPASGYRHADGCAITGGAFYAPAAGANTFGAAYAGLYFFSDYCNGWIKTLDPANNTIKAFATNVPRPISLEAAPDGSLYYVCRGARAPGLSSGSAEDNASTQDGSLYRIQGPITTGLASPPGSQLQGRPAALPLVPTLSPSSRLRLPQGMGHAYLYDLKGNRVWEYHGPRAAVSTWLDLPATLPTGALRVRYR